MTGKNPIQIDLASRLRKAREGLGLTQQQVADLVGCARLRWVRIEGGQAIPDWEELFELSILFRVPVNVLLGKDSGARLKWRVTKQSKDTRLHLGRKLQLLRKAQGLSRAELAKLLNCSSNRIYLVEHGKGALSAIEVRHVCDEFGVEPIEFYSTDPEWYKVLTEQSDPAH